MREVDEHWPQDGVQLHHSVAAWPLLLDDTTTVLESRPLALLSLRARAWPTGEAGVVLHLEPHGDETQVTIEEDLVSGPSRLLPKPLRTPLLSWRNGEAMSRLAFLVERRSA